MTTGEQASATRFVIMPDVALRLAAGEVLLREGHSLVAPTLLRSQVLALLYGATLRGELTRRDADRQLDHLRALRVRLLGDRVLQRHAWTVAEQLGWSDTFDAEYVALTQLQADVLVTLDPEIATAAAGLVTVADIDVLL
ncbi:type II toxin-antitoxin system VapC family toxin [Humibacillus xanthopallidus]|uniref:type II toxin-antitoxin system VapC family toxin n=1 Tax=Humibacillus xanthopallidus TaxID=412689 RepID=UPI00384AF46D